MKNNILIIGNFGYGDNNICGQTIRSRNVKKLIEENEYIYDYIDTSILKNKWRYISSIFSKIIKNKKFVLLFAQNNLKYFFPVIFIISKLFNKEIIYIAIGGWLADFVSERKIIKWQLRNVKSVMVQTNGLKEKLIGQGFNNVKVLPNFKIVKPISKNYESTLRSTSNSEVLNMVFMSRVNKDKGLDIVDELFAKNIKNIKLDIYGPIDPKGEDYLNSILKKYDTINYKGVLNQDELHDVISSYDFLLFPSHYAGEGYPGTILDAFIAGIPVIASDWKYNKELVIENETGYLFNLEDISSLQNILNDLAHDSVKLKNLKSKLLKKRNEFHYKKLSKPLLDELANE